MIVAAEQPAFRFGNLEHCAPHGDAQIGAFNHHEAASHGEPIDCSDHRLFQRPGHERVFEHWRAASRGAPFQRFLHIFSGAESASRTGKNRDLKIGVLLEGGKSLSHLRTQLGAQGVHPFRPVQTDLKNLPLSFGFHESHVYLPVAYPLYS